MTKTVSLIIIFLEQNLKIRWHSILRRYQNDEFYKYANLLHFLNDNRNTNMKASSKWPEFEITEEDVAEYQTSNTEEYVFLEVEDLETPTVVDELCAAKDVHEKDSELKTYQDDPQTIKDDDSEEGRTFRKKCESTDEHNGSKREEYITNPKKTPPHSKIILKTYESDSDTQPENKKYENATTADRCEDVIFGELVTAMLMRMNEDKKRQIKKEIMNILLT